VRRSSSRDLASGFGRRTVGCQEFDQLREQMARRGSFFPRADQAETADDQAASADGIFDIQPRVGWPCSIGPPSQRCGGVALLDRRAVSKMCHCLSALGQAVPMEDRLTTHTACPKADKQWHVQCGGKPEAEPPCPSDRDESNAPMLLRVRVTNRYAKSLLVLHNQDERPK
jgi:hypothetical protein